jgi:hypothetical protein
MAYVAEGSFGRIYLEGRCRRCGMRVTVERAFGYHRRDARWCGPVETEHPFTVSDEPTGDDWVVRQDRVSR